MKIIDLLNKIANVEEVPKKIKYKNKEFEYIGGAYEDEKGNDLCYYDDSCMVFLNDEVEILEEEKKIPEEIECYHQYDECAVKDKFYQEQKGSLVDEIIIDKINEIIDYLKSKGDE